MASNVGKPPDPRDDPLRNELLHALYVYWSSRFTTVGKGLALSLVLAMMVGSVSLAIPVYQLFSALAFLFGVSLVSEWVRRPKVKLNGSWPERVTAGESCRVRFTVENTSRRDAFDVSVALFDAPRELRVEGREQNVRHLPPGAAEDLEVDFEARRRGVYAVPPAWAFSTYPFNLWRHALGRRELRPLIVAPAFHPLEEIRLRFEQRYQPGGVALSSNVGESAEYIGNRDYRPGDPLRRIDYRSWGRLTRPVVREFHEEYYCRVGLVLDTYVRGRFRRTSPAFEAAVSLAASIADALTRGEYIIDFFAAGPELYVFRAGRSLAHFDDVLEILAGVGPCRDDPFAKLLPALAEEAPRVSSMIYILLDWDGRREPLVRMAAEAGCAGKVVLVRNGEPSENLGGAESWTDDVALLAPEDVTEGRVAAI